MAKSRWDAIGDKAKQQAQKTLATNTGSKDEDQQPDGEKLAMVRIGKKFQLIAKRKALDSGLTLQKFLEQAIESA